MAVSFKVFNTGTTASMVNSGYNNGFVKGTEIYANIFNGLFKDVSLVTVGLLNAIIAKSGYDVSGVTFDNALSEADMTTYCTSLLGGLSVASAAKWTTSRSVTIKDYNSGNTGMGTTVDGTSNVVLTLPQSINCNASNAAKWTTARNFTIKDADESNAGTTVAVDGTSTITLKLPSTIKATLDGNASSATNATNAVNATNATNATYAMYTDSSHTSKTIEQRLTELGFRYPSSSQYLTLMGDGQTIGHINVLGGSGNTSREGNRVILKLSVELSSSSGTTGQALLFSGTVATSTAAIPVEYRPKVNTTFYVPSGQTRYQFTDISSTTYSLRDYCPVKVVVNTDGTFTMSMDNRPTSDFTLMQVGAKTTSIKVGYQANPIE